MRSPVGAKVFKLSLGGGGRWQAKASELHPQKNKTFRKTSGFFKWFQRLVVFHHTPLQKMCKLKIFPQMGMNIKTDLKPPPRFLFFGGNRHCHFFVDGVFWWGNSTHCVESMIFDDTNVIWVTCDKEWQRHLRSQPIIPSQPPIIPSQPIPTLSERTRVSNNKRCSASGILLKRSNSHFKSDTSQSGSHSWLWEFWSPIRFFLGALTGPNPFFEKKIGSNLDHLPRDRDENNKFYE